MLVISEIPVFFSNAGYYDVTSINSTQKTFPHSGAEIL